MTKPKVHEVRIEEKEIFHGNKLKDIGKIVCVADDEFVSVQEKKEGGNPLYFENIYRKKSENIWFNFNSKPIDFKQYNILLNNKPRTYDIPSIFDVERIKK